MSIDLILSIATVIATAMTTFSLYVAIKRVRTDYKIKYLEKRREYIENEIARAEVKMREQLKELRKIKDNIENNPDGELSEEERKALANQIDEILGKYNE